MHPLRSHILKELTLKKDAHYSDLKPQGVESNRFVYHLKRLLQDGLIIQTQGAYGLTAPGKRHIDKLSLKSFLPRPQPKIVTALIVQDRDNRYLLMHSKRQPFIDKVSFPYGKVHYGEIISEAAARELKEKAALIVPLKHCGDAYLAIRDQGEIVSHMLCHVFYGKYTGRADGQDFKTHSIYWSDLGAIPKNKYVPGFLKLDELRKKSARFFVELTV